MQSEDDHQRLPRRFSLPKEWGVDQPDFFPHVTDEEREAKMEELRQRSHTWISEGPDAVCVECEHKHGFYIGPNKIVVGTDENNLPILQDLTLDVKNPTIKGKKPKTKTS